MTFVNSSALIAKLWVIFLVLGTDKHQGFVFLSAFTFDLGMITSKNNFKTIFNANSYENR